MRKIVALSSREREEFEMQVMRFVASANLPFTVVENPEFQKLCDLLRGSHCPLPTRKKLSTELLPGLYEDTKKLLSEVLSGKVATMVFWFKPCFF